MLIHRRPSEVDRSDPRRLSTALAVLFRAGTWSLWHPTHGRARPTQAQALTWIAAHTRGFFITQDKLASALGVNRATASRLVAALAARGLVRRWPLGVNRRKRVLALTLEGESAVREMMCDEEWIRVLEAMPQRRRRALARGLAGLLSELARRGRLPGVRPWRPAWPLVEPPGNRSAGSRAA